jgi:hypothetical protein
VIKTLKGQATERNGIKKTSRNIDVTEKSKLVCTFNLDRDCLKDLQLGENITDAEEESGRLQAASSTRTLLTPAHAHTHVHVAVSNEPTQCVTHAHTAHCVTDRHTHRHTCEM